MSHSIHEAARTAHFFSVGAEHTTARYLERAARTGGWKTAAHWGKVPRLEALSAQDLLVFVDPAPDWPLGLEVAACPTVGYMIDVHVDLGARIDLARFFDFVFVAQKDYVAEFASAGIPDVQWLPLACDPELHRIGAGNERMIDVAFVGQRGSLGSRRRQLLDGVLPHFRTNDHAGFVPPAQMARTYATAKIVFNASVSGDVNMRVFEALASGALLVTDRVRNGMDDMFTEGEHYVAYSSSAEAIEKVRYYLDNPRERESIAARGRQVVFSKHTYGSRWVTMTRSIGGARAAQIRKLEKSRVACAYASVFASLREPARVLGVGRRYGWTGEVAYALIRAVLRWVNARVPMSPQAIKQRWARRLTRASRISGQA